jgi:hypothetical protein
MKFLNGSLITNPRGSIGGITFSQGPAGNFARCRRIPINKRTVTQLTQRSITGRLSQRYKGIGTTNINNWKALALLLPQMNKLMQVYYWTPLQLYLYINVPLYISGQPVLDSPPSITGNNVPQLSALSVTIVGSGLTVLIGFTWTAIVSGTQHPIISASFPMGLSKKSPDYYKMCSIVTTPNSAAFDASTDYINKIGIGVHVGDKIFFKIYVLDWATGFRSQVQYISAIAS